MIKNILIILLCIIILIGISLPIFIDSIDKLLNGYNSDSLSKYILKSLFALGQIIFLIYIALQQLKKDNNKKERS